MRLDNIAIELAIGEKDWDKAIRLLASLFPLDGIGEAIAKSGLSIVAAPKLGESSIEIRWQYNIYRWDNRRVYYASYPVYYSNPLAILYCKGI